MSLIVLCSMKQANYWVCKVDTTFIGSNIAHERERVRMCYQDTENLSFSKNNILCCDFRLIIFVIRLF